MFIVTSPGSTLAMCIQRIHLFDTGNDGITELPAALSRASRRTAGPALIYLNRIFTVPLDGSMNCVKRSALLYPPGILCAVVVNCSQNNQVCSEAFPTSTAVDLMVPDSETFLKQCFKLHPVHNLKSARRQQLNLFYRSGFFPDCCDPGMSL